MGQWPNVATGVVHEMEFLFHRLSVTIQHYAPIYEHFLLSTVSLTSRHSSLLFLLRSDQLYINKTISHL